MKHPEIINKLSLKQKAKLLSGVNYWNLYSIPELGLPEIMITDGPHGLRKKSKKKQKINGISLGNSVPATCMPPAVTAACSWDENLLFEEGKALGEECLQEKVSVLLGPGTNIKRSPTGGRNFEYFSEDPLLSGKMAASLIKGCQSMGVGTSLKHFACNSQEAFRMVIDEIIDIRAIRELYLTAFEIAIKEAKPWTVMNSYNKINGVYSSQNSWLQNKVAREEWGFDGVFVTDWGASVDRIPGLLGGTDLEMPSSGTLNTKKIISAVKNGTLSEETVNERADNIIDLILKSKKAFRKDYKYDIEKHHETARKVAENSMVLLKNENNLLPLKKEQKIAVIGEMAKEPRYQGAGTSVVKPLKLDNAYNEFIKAGFSVTYSRGYYKSTPLKNGKTENQLIEEAAEAAKKADIAIVFAGLTEGYEAEGYDRQNINMPPCHNRLIETVAEANPNMVVVLAGGSVVLMPWINKVKAVLNSGLGGQAGGGAVVNILSGKVNPSGKTSETYPLSFEDNPVFGNFPGGPYISEHKESIYIGYRYYDTAEKQVLFPFGFGLSYTTFEYSDLKVSSKKIKDTDKLTVSVKIKNTGNYDGAEVAELYVSDVNSTIFRPKKELKAFSKVFLKSGEEKEIFFNLEKRAFAFFNANINDWQVESGEFQIMIGASSRDIRLWDTVYVASSSEAEIPDYRKTSPAYYTADIKNMNGKQWEAVYGKELPKNERDKTQKLTIYNCLNDAADTKWGGRFCRIIKSIMSKMGSSDNGDSSMLEAMALQIPIRNFVQMSMGAVSPQMAKGLLMILNDNESTFLGFAKIFFRIGGLLLRLPKLLKSI